MHVILALSPHESDGLLEFTLQAAGIEFTYFQRIHSTAQIGAQSTLIIDPDQPGQDFLLRYRTLHQLRGDIPLIVLGPSNHITMKMIPWNPGNTTFLEGDNTLKRLESLLASPAEPAQPTGNRTVELFKGLKGIGLADILQMLCLSRWCGEIIVHNTGVNIVGKIAILHGDTHSATTALNNGENACYEMLAWRGCEFHFQEKMTTGPRTIFASWEALLMEAACRIDESAHAQVC